MLIFWHFYLTIKHFSGDLCGIHPRGYWLLILPITLEGTRLCPTDTGGGH